MSAPGGFRSLRELLGSWLAWSTQQLFTRVAEVAAAAGDLELAWAGWDR
jgi:hypothetical protein